MVGEEQFRHTSLLPPAGQHLRPFPNWILILLSSQPDIIIAGTEQYRKIELDCCPNLKLICRAGVGIDNIDLDECKKRNIIVTNVPSAPSHAVAELTICQMINLLRRIPQVNRTWDRYIGKEIRDCNIGVIGVGRIGKVHVLSFETVSSRSRIPQIPETGA